MSDIRKQLGLDFMRRSAEQRGAGAEPGPESPPPFLSEALLSYGRPILEACRRAAPGTVRLHALIEQLQIPIDVALKVTEYLEANKYLTVVHRDLKGNHELRLTDEGRKLLG